MGKVTWPQGNNGQWDSVIKHHANFRFWFYLKRKLNANLFKDLIWLRLGWRAINVVIIIWKRTSTRETELAKSLLPLEGLLCCSPGHMLPLPQLVLVLDSGNIQLNEQQNHHWPPKKRTNNNKKSVRRQLGRASDAVMRWYCVGRGARAADTSQNSLLCRTF